ncbi:MAG TPA: TetR/AcrR family transcriptional regulator [Pseudolysinimonas sp.]|jgi:AcrR family transcriptional regulator|nr:TetR/AcrR family transcriptional regulator [Pseudolysinimonas sp.]
MPRPRFDKLTAGQQAAILEAAAAEFAAHGYAGASLNRIIDAAKISKGSMYYYFDDKEDLYAHVLRREIVGLVERTGPVPVPDTPDPEEFWRVLTEAYLGLLRVMRDSPRTATLLRGWLSAAPGPGLDAAQHDAEREVLPWIAQTLAAGRRAGAVRDDLPDGLLIALAMGIGQAIDVWLITQPPDDAELPQIVNQMMDLMRRALAPPH